MRIVSGFAFLVLLTGCAPSPMNDIDLLLRDYTADVPGASVVVVRGDRVILRKSYGLANLEERTTATPATHYRLASVTKQFTAAAILRLAEQKKHRNEGEPYDIAMRIAERMR